MTTYATEPPTAPPPAPCRLCGGLLDLDPTHPHAEADCPGARDRCTSRRCGHLRLAHIAARTRGARAFPMACAVQICACEAFRAEADR